MVGIRSIGDDVCYIEDDVASEMGCILRIKVAMSFLVLSFAS
jgi:hypothetical protein